MSEQIKQDIDLIEILFYLKKKIRIILFIIAICMAMVLLFLYNREIKLEWSGDKRDLPTAEAEISRVHASIINGMRQNTITAGKFSMRYKHLQQLTVSFIQK